MADIFVSYKSETEKQSLAFVQQLEKEGIRCWIACRDIPLGADYIDEIPVAIDECPCFLLLLSENVATSPWIKLEVKQAISDGKYILPIMMEDFEIHRSYKFMLQNFQIYSVFNNNQEAYELVVSRIHQLFPNLMETVSKSTPVPQARPVPRAVSALRHEPYGGVKPYIFLNYAHKDKDRVMPIVHLLQDRGFRIWWDDCMAAGVEWEELLQHKIEHCACVLSFLSDAFQQSRWCRNELEYAFEKKSAVFPVLLDECKLAPGMALQLAPYQVAYRNRHDSDEAFVEYIETASNIQICREQQDCYL